MKIKFIRTDTLMANSRYLGIILTSVLIGILISYQYQSYQKVSALINNRDGNTTFFEEIDIMLRTNQSYKEQLENFAEENQQYSDQAQAADALRKEIESMKKLAGYTNVKGPGILVRIDQATDMTWFIDLVNELLSVGAEAISINGIRLVNTNLSFYSLPGNQVILNGVRLNAPYNIEAIGDPDTMLRVLAQAGGIITRIRSAYPQHNIDLERKELIEIKKIL